MFLKGSSGYNIKLQLKDKEYVSLKLSKTLLQKDEFFNELAENKKVRINTKDIESYASFIRGDADLYYKAISLLICSNAYKPIFERDLEYMAERSDGIKSFALELLNLLDIERIPVLDFGYSIESKPLDFLSIERGFDEKYAKNWWFVPSQELYAQIKEKQNPAPLTDVNEYVQWWYETLKDLLF